MKLIQQVKLTTTSETKPTMQTKPGQGQTNYNKSELTTTIRTNN
nr:hypothetical protein [Mycoplasmopsis bovis]